MAGRQTWATTERQINEKEAKYHGDNTILGISALTYPAYIDSSRTIMDVNHQQQRVVLEHTEFPLVFTNNENMYGHKSSFNIEAKSDLEVIKVIPKFSKLNLDKATQPTVIIFYNKEKDEYDLIYKQDVQNLPEKYGIQNDHSVLDELEEGDIVKKGTPLSRPTSYDEFDNYGFGQNINYMYNIDMYSIEDAIEVSDVLAKSFISTECDLIKVTINDNNFLGNVYGDETYYKCFPDIGEKINYGLLCNRKIINKSQMFYDMKNSNLKESKFSDIDFQTTGEIVDIDVFCNKERNQLQETAYNEQIINYIDMDIEFHTKVYNATKDLINSGKKVSLSVTEWYNNTKRLLDKREEGGYKIKDDNQSVFSHIEIFFLVKRKEGLRKGQKLVGRFGNKGVISKITPVKEMPHFGNGEVVHVKLNTLGVPNRLNIMQLYEQSITAQIRIIVDHFKSLSVHDIEQKENIFFRFLATYNEKQAKIVYDDYIAENRTREEKERYFTDYIEKYGIFTHIESFWHEKLLWDSVNEVYNMFDFMEPYRVYFWQKDTERWVPQIRSSYVGMMYIMKMKQSSKKGLSVRSTGAINNRGLPCKSDDAKKFVIKHSNTPVRSGRQELENKLMFIDPETIVKDYLFQGSSPVGRMELGTQLMDHYEGVEDIEPTDLMVNKNVEQLEAHLLQMGFEIEFSYDVLDMSDEPGIKTHIYNGRKYICTTEEMCSIIAKDLAYIRVKEMETGEMFLGYENDYDSFIDTVAKELESQIIDYMK